MRLLVPENEFGLFATADGQAKTSSLAVAKFFGKEHNHVIRDIENLDCSPEFRLSNYGQSEYINQQGHKQPCVEMNFEGFVFLAMGYRGEKASRIKENYIRHFTEMKCFIDNLTAARGDFSVLTDAIQAVYGNEAPHYLYSNEINMINGIVLGMSAKKFRELHDIPKQDGIRPHMTKEQLKALDKLQKADVGLLLTTPDYHERKRILQEYYNKIRTDKSECA